MKYDYCIQYTDIFLNDNFLSAINVRVAVRTHDVTYQMLSCSCNTFANIFRALLFSFKKQNGQFWVASRYRPLRSTSVSYILKEMLTNTNWFSSTVYHLPRNAGSRKHYVMLCWSCWYFWSSQKPQCQSGSNPRSRPDAGKVPACPRRVDAHRFVRSRAGCWGSGAGLVRLMRQICPTGKWWHLPYRYNISCTAQPTEVIPVSRRLQNLRGGAWGKYPPPPQKTPPGRLCTGVYVVDICRLYTFYVAQNTST